MKRSNKFRLTQCIVNTVRKKTNAYNSSDNESSDLSYSGAFRKTPKSLKIRWPTLFIDDGFNNPN